MDKNTKKIDPRPEYYLYWRQLLAHLKTLGKDESCFFNGELIYPRQFEIHLPGNKIKACDLHCPHCAGSKFDKSLGDWEMDGIELLDKLQGKIPYHIYGGAYTEPLMNPYFMAFMAMTKKYGNHFGIHTNGTNLLSLDNGTGFLTELNRLSTDNVDYLSVSLDAGTPESWGKTKGTKKTHLYNDILKAVSRAVQIRKKNNTDGHAIRLCYLISPHSNSPEDFKKIVGWAKEHEVDSLRFSIPFDNYNKSFDNVRKYKAEVEIPMDEKYREMLSPYLSESQDEKPYIFYTGPEFTDIDSFTFDKCLYPYYQITYGADGYAYKCSTTATPTGKQCRFGKITADLDEFNKMILRNANPNWDCQKMCFERGLRGNRMAMEINTAAALYFKNKGKSDGTKV